MLKVASDNKIELPLGSYCIENNRYVDDIIDSKNDTNLLKTIKLEVNMALEKFGFEIKNWNSNCSNLS